MRKAEQIAPALAQRISSESEEKDPRGRKSHYGVPKVDIAKSLGVAEGPFIEAEQHVATADAHPFMQRPEWRRVPPAAVPALQLLRRDPHPQ